MWSEPYSVSCILGLLLLCTFNSCLCAVAAGSPAPLLLNITLGSIQGTYLEGSNGSIIAYRNIPFADVSSYTGSNRWKYAKAAGPWSGILNGTGQTAQCMQSLTATTFTGTEDCLYIDVYVPTDTTYRPAEGWPVFVDIPSGGFASEGAAQYFPGLMPYYQNFIGVEIRYRNNVFGFLSTPGLSSETSPIQSSGNYALTDQQLALRWVKQYISDFGANPNSITLNGQSSGAWSACLHLVMPGSAGLFNYAMIESGSCDDMNVIRSLSDQEQTGSLIVNAAQCNVSNNYTAQVQCMRQLSASAVLGAWYAVTQGNWYIHNFPSPTVDGYIIPNWPQTMFQKGQVNNISALFTGADSEEGTLSTILFPLPAFVPPLATWNTTQQWLSNWTSVAGVNQTAAQLLMQKYSPSGLYGSFSNASSTATWGPSLAISDILTAIFYRCGTRRMAQWLSSLGTATYLYDYRILPVQYMNVGVFHTINIVYMLGTTWPITVITPAEEAATEKMTDFWVAFIVNHNPNEVASSNKTLLAAASTVQWLPYTPSTHNALTIGNDTSVDNTTIYNNPTAFNVMCDLFDAIITYPTYTPRCSIGYTLQMNNNSDTLTCV